MFTFLVRLRKVTFDISEVYLEPSQLFEAELFAEIVECFQATSIFTKSSIIDVWLKCSEHRNSHFDDIYLSDKSDTENDSD